MEADLSKYYKFLENCKKKVYEGGTHRHHIIPVFMGGTNDESNFIRLGHKDHQKAHIILAQCFPKDDPRHYKNMCSAGILQKWVNNPNIGKLLSEALKGIPKSEEAKKNMRGPRPNASGENNHFYGKGHFGKDNPMYGRSFESVWIEKYGEEIANDMLSEFYVKRGKEISMALKGVPKSDEHKQNLSKAKKEFWENASEEYKQEWSRKMSEKPTYERDEEHKKKMSEIIKKSRQEKPLKKYTCVHCGKEATKGNINRWHNDNCKHKN